MTLNASIAIFAIVCIAAGWLFGFFQLSPKAKRLIDDAEDAARYAADQLKAVKDKLNRTTSEKQALSQDVTRLQGEREDLSKMNATQGQRIEGLENQVAGLRAQVSTLKATPKRKAAAAKKPAPKLTGNRKAPAKAK